jgi:hypothetical protein
VIRKQNAGAAGLSRVMLVVSKTYPVDEANLSSKPASSNEEQGRKRR